MRRTPLTRALAALMGLWLALVLGEPAALHHRCPMHDGPAPAAAEGMHAGHGESHTPAHGGHACTCVGACSAAGSTAAPAAAAEPLVVLARWRSSPAPHGGDPASPARRAFALPFANGPPVSRFA